jgi:hypothetical protein
MAVFPLLSLFLSVLLVSSKCHASVSDPIGNNKAPQSPLHPSCLLVAGTGSNERFYDLSPLSGDCRTGDGIKSNETNGFFYQIHPCRGLGNGTLNQVRPALLLAAFSALYLTPL